MYNLYENNYWPVISTNDYLRPLVPAEPLAVREAMESRALYLAGIENVNDNALKSDMLGNPQALEDSIINVVECLRKVSSNTFSIFLNQSFVSAWQDKDTLFARFHSRSIDFMSRTYVFEPVKALAQNSMFKNNRRGEAPVQIRTIVYNYLCAVKTVEKLMDMSTSKRIQV